MRIIISSRKQGSPLAPLMNSNTSQRIEKSQDRQKSETYPLILFAETRDIEIAEKTIHIKSAIDWLLEK